MAGISISAIVGDNGIIEKARNAREETDRASVKEELEMKVLDLQVEKEKTGEKITNEDIANAISSLKDIEIDSAGNKVEGEYKEFGYEIDKDGNVIVSKKLTGEKPVGRIEIDETEDLEEVQIRVIGSINGSKISSIESLEGIEIKEEKNSAEVIFVVRDNGTYNFRIRGENGRIATISCNIDNAIPLREDLLDAIEKIQDTKVRKVKVLGKTNADAQPEEVIYSLNVIKYTGKMVLDGQTKFEGSSLSGQTYSFGSSDDIAPNLQSYAKNTVVLKVEGDLVINSGITLTTIYNSYSGPKGLIIYCTGTITNNGVISMNSRGAYSPGDNLYLKKRSEDEFIFVPKIGRCRGKWDY